MLQPRQDIKSTNPSISFVVIFLPGLHLPTIYLEYCPSEHLTELLCTQVNGLKILLGREFIECQVLGFPIGLQIVIFPEIQEFLKD